MHPRSITLGLILIGALCVDPRAAAGQGAEAATVNASIAVLQNFTNFKAQSIPQSMLNDAQAIAIIPNVVKGGFVIAGRFGRGVVVVRNADGSWRAPVFITFTGGSVGWQVGLQSTDIVLVFKNRKGVETMLSGREFTLGADAAVAAGPVGRQATAATDIKLNAEIFSYSSSRGLFVGVALDGSVMKVDSGANAAFYANGTVLPPPAMQLVQLIARDTTPGAVAQPVSTGPMVPPPATVATAAAAAVPPTATPDQLRQMLAESSARLNLLVDTAWQQYLALPAQVYTGAQPPVRADLTVTLARYDAVMQNPMYAALTAHPEFGGTDDLLRRYIAALDAAVAAQTAAQPNPLSALPPPPPGPVAGSLPPGAVPQAGVPQTNAAPFVVPGVPNVSITPNGVTQAPALTPPGGFVAPETPVLPRPQ